MNIINSIEIRHNYSVETTSIGIVTFAPRRYNGTQSSSERRGAITYYLLSPPSGAKDVDAFRIRVLRKRKAHGGRNECKEGVMAMAIASSVPGGVLGNSRDHQIFCKDHVKGYLEAQTH